MSRRACMQRALIVCICASALGGAAEPPEAAKIDAVFASVNKPNGPGAAVAVISHGKLIYEKGYGSANLEYNIPITPETIFHVASVSKQFTAMAVVLLEIDGKLSIDDDVRTYLPELPDYGRKIALRNLLQHTSGVRDQWQTLAIAGWSLEDVITHDQILRMLFRQKELNFPPGTRHMYSNGGYSLLAEVVTRVSGKPFPEFCAERIFKPLLMSRTHFHQDLHRIVPGRAYSYFPARDGFENAPLNYANIGATSLFTTAGDLARWLDNFRHAKVGGARAVARMQEQCVLANGENVPYGLGLSVGKYRGLRTVSHGGGDAGFRSYVAWFPDEEVGVAVVSNLGSFSPLAAANKVADTLLVARMESAKPLDKKQRAFIALDEAVQRRYAGVYPLSRTDQVFRAEFEGGKLWAVTWQSKSEMKPDSATTFYVPETGLDVQFTPKGDSGMLAKVGSAEGERFIGLDAAGLKVYTGVYWSEELETQYTVALRDGRLVADHSHHGEIPLLQTGTDQFTAARPFLPKLLFVRDESGAIVGMKAGGGRVTGIYFRRRSECGS